MYTPVRFYQGTGQVLLFQHPELIVRHEFLRVRVKITGQRFTCFVRLAHRQRLVQVKALARGQNNCSFNDIFQFSDIARPIPLKRLRRSLPNSVFDELLDDWAM